MIRARGVSYAYGGAPVFEGLDIDAGEGATVAIVGPSGCGKTTVLRVLAGLLSPGVGRVELPPAERDRAAVALAFQDPRLLPWMTVGENLAFALEAAGMDRASWRERAAPLLDKVGLSSVVDLRPGALSGGMSQRVALVRALLLRPRCLLLDEPFASVDTLLRERLQSELQSLLAASDTTVVLVTHDVGEALFMGDRVLVLSARPAHIAATFDVAAPRPRAPGFRADPRTLALAAHVRGALGG